MVGKGLRAGLGHCGDAINGDIQLAKLLFEYVH